MVGMHRDAFISKICVRSRLALGGRGNHRSSAAKERKFFVSLSIRVIKSFKCKLAYVVSCEAIKNEVVMTDGAGDTDVG